ADHQNVMSKIQPLVCWFRRYTGAAGGEPPYPSSRCRRGLGNQSFGPNVCAVGHPGADDEAFVDPCHLAVISCASVACCWRCCSLSPGGCRRWVASPPLPASTAPPSAFTRRRNGLRPSSSIQRCPLSCRRRARQSRQMLRPRLPLWSPVRCRTHLRSPRQRPLPSRLRPSNRRSRTSIVQGCRVHLPATTSS